MDWLPIDLKSTWEYWVADCAAVLMADTKNGVIGAFHAGWRGAVANILPAGLSAMRELGAREIAAWIKSLYQSASL